MFFFDAVARIDEEKNMSTCRIQLKSLFCMRFVKIL